MEWTSETPRPAKRGGRAKEKCALALDVGGTFLKSAIISSKGSLLEKTFHKTPINSQGSAEKILGTFAEVLKTAFQMADVFGLDIVGLGIGMPGPFDYGAGISLMEHKYASIYGLNVKREIIRRLDLEEDFPIRFENDAWVFLRGEAWHGAAQGYGRIVGMTLGTGLGSAFMVDDEIVIEGSGVPMHAWVGALPYDDGIVEDKISQRGIIARYRELSGNSFSGNEDVKEIALKGLRHRDKNSLKVFCELGSTLAQVLRPILSDFRAECLVLGGQISKSFSLFETPLKKQLRGVSSLKKITRARFVDLSALYGAAKIVFQKKIKRWGVIGVDE